MNKRVFLMLSLLAVFTSAAFTETQSTDPRPAEPNMKQRGFWIRNGVLPNQQFHVMDFGYAIPPATPPVLVFGEINEGCSDPPKEVFLGTVTEELWSGPCGLRAIRLVWFDTDEEKLAFITRHLTPER